MGKSSRRNNNHKGGGGGGGCNNGSRRNIMGTNVRGSNNNAASSASSSASASASASAAGRRAKRESDMGSTLIHLGIIWLVVGVLIQVGKGYREGTLSLGFGGGGAGGILGGGGGNANATQQVAVVTNSGDTAADASAAIAHAETAETAAAGADSANAPPDDPPSTAAGILKMVQAVAASAAGFVAKPMMTYNGFSIPAEQLQSMDVYPNALEISDEMRSNFHPVVKFPTSSGGGSSDNKRAGFFSSSQRGTTQEVVGEKEGTINEKGPKLELPYKVMDFTKRMPDDKSGGSIPTPGSLIPHDKWNELMKQRKRAGVKIPYTIGRYDEDRRNMYSSDLFSQGSDGGDDAAAGKKEAAKRTVHIGIDLGGPVGTKVYAFADGVVHSAGCNAAWGDYGHVIVVEHELARPQVSDEDSSQGSATEIGNTSKIWALYGHLDAGSIKGKRPGKRIKKGQVLGKLGDMNHNGGWYDPHVHFQLSINPPETHDMPGVVATADRLKALVEYPDPRLVLGPLY